MSGPCTLGTYQYEPNGSGLGYFPQRCTCANCTEREANVLAESNARRKALLALDQAMTDLDGGLDNIEEFETLVGQATAVHDAWVNARRFVMGGGA